MGNKFGKKVVWWFIVASIVVAIWRVVPHDGAGLRETAEREAPKVQQIAEHLGETIKNMIGKPETLKTSDTETPAPSIRETKPPKPATSGGNTSQGKE
jgi:hypothetical protein